MATPVVTALRDRHPDAAIDFLASGAAAPLLQGIPEIHQVLKLHRRNVPYWLSVEKIGLVSDLRTARYDLAVVLEHAPRYYELVERAGIPRIVGFRDTRFDPSLHSIANNLRAAGFDDGADRSWRMLITPVDDTWAAARQIRHTHGGPLVGFHVGYGPARRKKDQEQRLRGWALENFTAVGKWLIERDAAVVLNGAREDRPTVDRLAAMLPRERVFLAQTPQAFRAEVLEAAIEKHGLPRQAFEWYLDLRRYGTVPHAGFGMGVERCVAWICGLHHVRETIPFARMMERITP